MDKNINISLNKEQLSAVKHKDGPLLIIAGAGTGKTTVITERIKNLISSNKAVPSEILALTFTEKAAREMEERVDVAMPYGYTQMWISTFHSFCDRILRQEILHIGFDPRYKLMTQAETIQFIRKNLFKYKFDYFRPLGNPTKYVEALMQHFSRLQDEDITTKQYIRWFNSKKTKKELKKEDINEGIKWQELTSAYKKYEELKINESVMDYGDLITKTLLLFRKRPNILRKYQKQFKHVLVDEFQDTNISQYELIRLLAPPSKSTNLTVVGDDSQSIYKFRGAAVSNILSFISTYKKAKTVVLKKNYRSTQAILDPAYRLISHNNPDTLETKLGIDKNLLSIPKPRGGEKISLIHKDRVENEADAVAKEIEKIILSKNYEYKDIAILVRANNHSESFIRAFQRHSIPYQFLGPGRLFKQPEIIDLIAYLKVLYNFDDSVSLYRILSIRHFDISAKDLVKIGNYGRRFNLSLFESCRRINDIYVEEKTRKTIKRIIKIIRKHLKAVRKETAGQLLYYFLEDADLISKLLDPDTEESERRVMNISKFFDKLKTYEIDHENSYVEDVVDWIELSSELGESPLAADIDWSEINAVNLLTAHSSKGLEFPVVFMVNLVGQRFPSIERKEKIPIPDALIKEILPEGDYHLQEERRLFYVGMTRAKDKLYFSAANYYGEAKREKRLSPFIFEALGDEAVIAEKPGEGEQLSFLDYSGKKAKKEKKVFTKFHIDYLSYSQIETFRICPLHYKLKYIYKIPTPPSAAQSFGISMHNALNSFYSDVMLEKKQYKKLVMKALKDNWMAEGYKSKAHETRMKRRGEKYLLDYLDTSFNPKKTPLVQEKPFVVPLESNKGKRRLKIGGKIDRVDKLSGGKIEIIDYKTGANIPTQKDIDHDLQLTFYALAATSIKEYPFIKSSNEVKLTLYYFDNQQKVSTTRTKKQLKKAVDEIFEWRNKIERSDFHCSGHMFCNSCEYSLFCRTD